MTERQTGFQSCAYVVILVPPFVKNVVHHRIGGVQSALGKRNKRKRKLPKIRKKEFCFVSSGGVTRERERGSNNKHKKKKKKKKVPVVVVGGVRVFYGCNLRAPGQLGPGHRLFLFFYFFADWRRERDLCACEFCIDQRERERKKRKEKKGE
jgi:hypothetical protein